MNYRGEDLDLRTPQSRASRDVGTSDTGLNGTRSRQPAANGGRAEALYVDDTVLACCNHAYDVAHAHGANEVRLEHLVHALTRVEAAAEILEQRGIREAHLRRESAAVIASEIPVGLAHSHAAPRSSVEFEDVLRRASDIARGRSAAASVHDLLWVLLNYDRDITAIALLLRHAGDWQSWDWPHQADPRRESRESRSAYYAERRYAETPPPPRPRAVDIAPQPTAAYQPPTVVAYQPQSAPDLDAVHGRLDQMDAALRKMQGDLGADRRAITDMLRDVQRDLGSLRNAPGTGLPVGFIDRIQNIEHTVDARFQDFGRMLADIQREIANNRGGAVPVGFTDKLATVDRMVGAVGTVERTVGSLGERLQALERSVTSGMQDGARNWAALTDKLTAIGTNAGDGGNGLADLVTDQLITITSQVKALGDRMQAMEDGLSAQRTAPAVLQTLIADRVGAVTTAVRQQIEQQNLAMTSLVAQLTEPVTQRLALLEQQLASQGQALERGNQQIAQRVEERIAPLSQALPARIGELQQLVQSHGDRAVQYTQQVAQQAATAHKREMTDIHEAIVKLGQNQQTLAENLDQWRAEGEGGLSIVANRMEVLELAASKPVDMLKQLQTDMEAMQRVTLADYDQNRKGVRNWLFGTEDIFAGSWRDETRQIRERLRQMRTDRKETKA